MERDLWTNFEQILNKCLDLIVCILSCYDLLHIFPYKHYLIKKKNNWMSVDKQGTISLSFLISEYSFFKFSISQDLAKYGIPPARYQLTIVLNLSFCPWSARLFLDFDIYWALQSFFLILPLFGHPSTEEIFREYFWMRRGWLGLKAEWLIARQCFSLESVAPSH